MIKKANIILTHSCNLNCSHCYLDAKMCKEDYEKEFEDAKKLLLELKKNDFSSVMFTGGECMIFPKLKELIEYAKELEFEVSIFTNGMIYNEQIYDLLDSISISIDGSEKTHNSLRQNPDSYQRVLRVLDYLKEKDIYTSVQMTISNVNYKDLDFIPALTLGHLNIRNFKFTFVSNVGRAKNNNIYHDSDIIDYVYSHLDELYDKTRYHIQFITNLYDEYDFDNYCIKREPILPLWFDIPNGTYYLFDNNVLPEHKLEDFDKTVVENELNNVHLIFIKHRDEIIKNKYIDVESCLTNFIKGGIINE